MACNELVSPIFGDARNRGLQNLNPPVILTTRPWAHTALGKRTLQSSLCPVLHGNLHPSYYELTHPEDSMTSQEFAQELDTRIAKYDLLCHPFYKAWSEGKLTRSDLREYAH